ncbi:MAG TPA: NusG domain II-containing protein [Thioalkalivibrio sp.]|nr:NusG domain II-containing protein [Thioalkalivibrio sp.]
MKPGDWLVVVLAALLIGALYAHFWTPGAPAAYALIHAGDDAARQVALDEHRHLHVEGPLGTSQVEVRDGRARFTASPCNDRFCVHYGWLDHAGEVIACVPNRVVVQLVGPERDFDAINF